jgi:DNA end-binding protein Ku
MAHTRITLRPHAPGTGEEIEKREVVKGYEYSRGQFLTFTAEELKALDVESSKVVDLEKFVAGDDIDPIYFDSPYFVYLDGPIAVEVLRVIGAAMAKVRRAWAPYPQSARADGRGGAARYRDGAVYVARCR